MIIRTSQSDIILSKAIHIAFPVSAEGYNDTGLASFVSLSLWPEVENLGDNELGTVISKKVGNRTFHALVCYSMYRGWSEDQEDIIRECFDKIESNGAAIATVGIGRDFLDMACGADYRKILCGMHDSEKRIVLFDNITINEVLEGYEEEKENEKVKKIY